MGGRFIWEIDPEGVVCAPALLTPVDPAAILHKILEVEWA